MKKKDLKKIVKNLPRHPNVLGRHRFSQSAVVLPIIKIKKVYYLLFQKRASHISQGGDICFPGGRYDKKLDKNFKQTAIREMYEELGIEKKDIKILGQLDSHVATIGTIIEPFVAKISKKAYKNMKIDKNEVEKTILIPINFFKTHKPLEYNLKYEVFPYKINEKGKKEIYFPVKKLKLPKRYEKPWGTKNHKVWVYKYKKEVIWGITSVIIRDFISKY